MLRTYDVRFDVYQFEYIIIQFVVFIFAEVYKIVVFYLTDDVFIV